METINKNSGSGSGDGYGSGSGSGYGDGYGSGYGDAAYLAALRRSKPSAKGAGRG